MNDLSVEAEASSTATVISDAENLSEMAEELNKYLTFRLGDADFGIDLLRIKEIIEYASVCDIPMAPPHIRGVINLRGNVVPVIDLAKRIGIDGDEKSSKRSCIIIIDVKTEDESIDLGVVVDGVNKVYEIEEDEVEHAPAFGANIRADFIKGMGRIDRQFITLLKLSQVLDINELAIDSYIGSNEHS